MNTDDILVFHRMLVLGKAMTSRNIAMGLQHWRGPIYGMMPMGVPTISRRIVTTLASLRVSQTAARSVLSMWSVS